MNENTLVIKGYQPSAKVQDGYQPTTGVQKGNEQTKSTPVTMAKVIPPKGGSGETTLKKK
ncbi:MAG: hypothetical protein LBT00_06015 [Spirochaetaceae bacterium]|nr:hypothetical protein [Spirochaetaceae bacterium]